jgi:putative flippase GtrA
MIRARPADWLRAVAVRAGAIGVRFMFARYLLASVCALSLDMGLFLALSGADVPSALAACGGYVAGLLLHWAISIRFVFACERPSHMQRVAFLMSAIAGLPITVAIIETITYFGLGLAIAKLIAIPISFGTVYAIRKHGIFSPA